jgi:hypothetical protein
MFRHLLGVTAFSIDPYQIGYENEEGIESGAFWFYRKLGFRPMTAALLKLTLNEERRISQRSSYRTSAKTLRKLAEGPMILELEQSRSGDWDRFQIRRIGLAVQRLMAQRYMGDSARMRREAGERLARVLGLGGKGLAPYESRIWSDFAVALALIPNLNQWSKRDKSTLKQLISAKAGVNEVRYLKSMQRHERLRREFIRLGNL